VAGGLPQPLLNGTKLGAHFSEILCPYEYKINIKKGFIIELKNYQLACMANQTLMGQIDHAY